MTLKKKVGLTEFFALRLSPEMVEELEDEAAKAGLSVSSFVRFTLNKALHS